MLLKNPIYFFAILTIFNLIAYGLNIAISKIWDSVHGYKTYVPKKELYASLVTVFVNVAIAIPGFLLWKMNVITFSHQHILISFGIIFIVMDFLMYVFHFITHQVPIFKRIHAKHHEHTTKFNAVSLYYMSPWESVLFGGILTLIALVFRVSIDGFILFLIFNWWYGVITHLNVKTEKSTFFIFTTNHFHKNHHELNTKNYGFYTYWWDKIFNTKK